MSQDRAMLDPDTVAELALDYRNEMLRALGVVAWERWSTHTAPGERIRRLPVETVGAHEDVANTVGSHRILTDVRDYSGDSEIASADDVDYLTIRETTGYAAIQSSATRALGWTTMPTPREVRLAEHLDGIDRSDVRPGWPVPEATAAEEIVRMMVPESAKVDRDGLWVGAEDTCTSNVQAIKHCVTALRHREADPRYHLVRHRDEFDDDDVDGPLDHRISTPGIVIEKYFDNPSGTIGSESWHRVYAGLNPSEIDDVDVDAMGYVTFDWAYPDAPDADPFEIDTRVVTIPELLRPERVLDLPAPEPTVPESGTDE